MTAWMCSTLQSLWDSMVVGGGAAGLSAAMVLSRAGLHVLVIDAGSPRNRFAAHMHGVLGYDGRSPLDLVRAGREEVAGYGVQFLDGAVATVQDGPDAVTATTRTGQELRPARSAWPPASQTFCPRCRGSRTGGEWTCCTAPTATAGRSAARGTGSSPRHP